MLSYDTKVNQNTAWF